MWSQNGKRRRAQRVYEKSLAKFQDQDPAASISDGIRSVRLESELRQRKRVKGLAIVCCPAEDRSRMIEIASEKWQLASASAKHSRELITHVSSIKKEDGYDQRVLGISSNRTA